MDTSREAYSSPTDFNKIKMDLVQCIACGLVFVKKKKNECKIAANCGGGGDNMV